MNDGDLARGLLPTLFPFHLLLDERLRIVGVGPSITRVLPLLKHGDQLQDWLELDHPRIELTYDALRAARSSLCILRGRDGSPLLLRGQIVDADDDRHLVFIGSPWLRDPRELERLGLSLQDFALHDPAMDMLHVVQSQLTAFGELRVIAADLARRDEELREAHRELERRYEQVTRLSEARQQFLSNLSHELRTPLHAIVGAGELLAATQPQPEHMELVQQLRSSAETLERLIDDLFGVGGETIARPETSDGPVTLETLVRRAAERSSAGSERPDVTVDVTVRAAATTTMIEDPAALGRIVQCLVDNAVRFVDGGSVEVVANVTETNDIQVAVHDDGPGIDPTELERIFEPFVQLDATRDRAHGGMGLGLAIARRLARSLGGDVRVESSAASGTTFHVNVPLLGARSAGTHGMLRVLVVEDDAINQLVITKMLERLGHESLLVSGGHDALDAIGERPFDVVLMDLHMPGLDGIETVARMRGAGLAGMPVIALTADVLPETRDACIEAGFNHVLTKPVRLATLTDALTGISRSTEP